MKAILRGGVPQYVGGAFTDEAGVSHPANVLSLWSNAELRAIGVYPVVDDPVPAGQIATAWTMTLDGDVVRRVPTLAPAPPPPVPAQISASQFFRALLRSGIVSPDEAKQAARDGTLPASVAAAFNAAIGAGQMTAQDKDDAEVLLARAQAFEREHSFFGLLTAAGIATPAQLDALFVAGAEMR